MKRFYKKKTSKVTFKTHHKHKPLPEEAKKISGGERTIRAEDIK